MGAVVIAGAGALWWYLSYSARRSARSRLGVDRPSRRPLRMMSAVTAGREAKAIDRALPAAMDAVAASLRSGAALGQALTEAAGTVSGPLASDLRAVTVEAAIGGDLDGALQRWSARRHTPAVGLAASSLGLGLETGGVRAQAVDGIAATLRQQRAVAAEAVALAAQARLSAVVMAAAPVAFCALGAFGGRGSAGFLVGTNPGRLCLATGLLLDGAGAWWMHRLSRPEP